MDIATQTTAQQKRFAISRRSLADENTPLIRNCWYVAARSDEVGRHLLSRTLLRAKILLFRREDGVATALADRCPHRSFPLSLGRLEGDDVICGYHGLRYGSDGMCREIPGRPGTPSGIGVRRYPVFEQAPFIWIWPGDPALAAASEPPIPPWLGDPAWDTQIGYLRVEGSYVHMHENLLDLSHLTFLHAASFGTPEYARAPIEMRVDDVIQVWRHVECHLPALYAKPLGWEGDRAMRRSGSEFVSPGLHVNTGLFENLDRPEASTGQPMVKVAQLLTPETQTSLHYFYALSRNFAVDDEETGRTMLSGLGRAFDEDRVAMKAIADAHEAVAAEEFYEFDIPTDRAGLEMRRRLKLLADQEAAHLS